MRLVGISAVTPRLYELLRHSEPSVKELGIVLPVGLRPEAVYRKNAVYKNRIIVTPIHGLHCPPKEDPDLRSSST